MNWISLFMMILITDLSGTGSYLLWKQFSHWMERRERIWGVRACLAIVPVFFLVPVMFLYMAFQTHLFSGPVLGSLFMRTPFLVTFTRIAGMIWLSGFLLGFVKDVKRGHRLRFMVKNACPAETELQKLAEEVEEALQIRSRIPVYRVPAKIVPAIFGFWRPKILLPDKKFEVEELNMILEHELWHYKQGDLLLKQLCVWAARIHWFNPCVRRLTAAVDKWGDIHCDLWLCHEGNRWDRKAYFLTVARNGHGASLDWYGGMSLRTGIEEIKERAVRMKSYNEQKEWKKRSSLLAVVLCFVLASSLTAAAAGSGLGSLYETVYDETQVIIEEELQSQPEVSEEREWLPDKDMVIIKEEGNLNGRSNYSYTWEISAGVVRETGKFYASKGSKVTISVAPDPANAGTGIGLDQPNGYLRGVSASGTYAHTFTVNETGNHRVYVRNESGKTISATVVVVR